MTTHRSTATISQTAAATVLVAADPAERRRYVRLGSVLPLELQLFDAQSHVWLTDTLQGYTQDVSEGGLCVRLFHVSSDCLRWLQDQELRIQLTIHLPPFRQPVRVVARVAWMEALHGPGARGYQLGVTFETMADADRQRLVRYARRTQWLPRLATVSLAMLMATVGGMFWHSRANANARRMLTGQVHELNGRETALRRQLASVEGQRSALAQQLASGTAQMERLVARAEALITPAIAVPAQAVPAPAASVATQAALTRLAQEDVALQTELRDVTTAKAAAEADILTNLYSWLRVHQYPMTGLLISYEGDSSLEDWAFTYDQALMAQCFLLFGDTTPARKLLEFFATKAQRVDGGFVNAYDAVSGNVREYAVHAGPNLWIGLAALQYTHATGDRQFLPLAVSVAAWAEQLQRQDPEGGLRGGPKETWFSTEHNLDAYAFFVMLAEVSGESRYRDDAQRVREWLQRHAHGRQPGQINRGRGDATIATDTFAWSVAAMTPETLHEMGFDPDAMLAFAEEHCAVRTMVVRPDKTRAAVEGFDFSKPRHLARGGIISTEWTGQMIVAMQMMAQYHRAAGRAAEAEQYRAKAQHYADELEKLMISSPCPLGHAGWALPYASQANVDTGHGWRTAHGATTGSASGTIYHIFARRGFNPLQLNGTLRREAAATHATTATP